MLKSVKSYNFMLLLFLNLLYLFLAAKPNDANSPTEEPSFEADDFYYSEDNQSVKAIGNAVFSTSNLMLMADEIFWDYNKSIIVAQGGAIMSSLEIRILAQKIHLDLTNGNLEATELKTGFHPWVLEADKLSRIKTSYELTNVNAYYRQKESLEPNLSAESLELDQNTSQFIAKRLSPRIGKFPLFIFPTVEGNLEKQNSSLSLKAGKKSTVGWFGGIDAEWEASRNFKAEMESLGYIERGIFLSPSFTYNKISQTDPDHLSMELNLGGIIDQKNSLGMDLIDEPIQRERGYAHFRTNGRIGSDLRIASNFLAQSDSEFYRDYRNDRFQNDQWHEHFGEIAYEGNLLTISVMSYWQMNDFEEQATYKPNLRLDLGPHSPLGMNFHQTISAEYAKIGDEKVLGRTFEKSEKMDFGYKLQRPITLPLGLTYLPSVSFRNQSYNLGMVPDANRQYGEWGNELSLLLVGDYGIQNDVWQINGIRHLSKFSLKHRRLTLLSSKNTDNIPIIDHPFIDLNLAPTDLLEHVEADEIKSSDIVRLEWHNQLLTNRDDHISELVSFNLFQDLWIKPEEGGDEVPHFFTEFKIKPASWLSLLGQMKIDVEKGRQVRDSLTCRITDGVVNKFAVSHYKYVNQGNQWLGEFQHRIDMRKSIRLGLRYDGEEDRFPYWMAAINYNPKGSWLLGTSVSKRTGSKKENEIEFAISANLLSF